MVLMRSDVVLVVSIVCRVVVGVDNAPTVIDGMRILGWKESARVLGAVPSVPDPAVPEDELEPEPGWYSVRTLVDKADNEGVAAAKEYVLEWSEVLEGIDYAECRTDAMMGIIRSKLSNRDALDFIEFVLRNIDLDVESEHPHEAVDLFDQVEDAHRGDWFRPHLEALLRKHSRPITDEPAPESPKMQPHHLPPTPETTPTRPAKDPSGDRYP